MDFMGQALAFGLSKIKVIDGYGHGL